LLCHSSVRRPVANNPGKRAANKFGARLTSPKIVRNRRTAAAVTVVMRARPTSTGGRSIMQQRRNEQQHRRRRRRRYRTGGARIAERRWPAPAPAEPPQLVSCLFIQNYYCEAFRQRDDTLRART